MCTQNASLPLHQDNDIELVTRENAMVYHNRTRPVLVYRVVLSISTKSQHREYNTTV